MTMNTIPSLILLVLALPTTAQLLRNERQLQQECAMRSSELGCYRDKKTDRALPHEIFGPESRKVSPAECETACASAGYDLWGRQFKGQCFCGSMAADYGFGRHGVTSGCDCCGDNVGSNKFCAYALDTGAPGCVGSGVSANSAYVGCYANRNNARALPVQIPGKGWSASECEAACQDKGYEFFAREWKGQW